MRDPDEPTDDLRLEGREVLRVAENDHRGLNNGRFEDEGDGGVVVSGGEGRSLSVDLVDTTSSWSFSKDTRSTWVVAVTGDCGSLGILGLRGFTTSGGGLDRNGGRTQPTVKMTTL